MFSYDYDDKRGFSFWPLKKIVTAQEELKRLSLAPTPAGLESYFIFADYLQWCWAYAIYLSPDVNAKNHVITIGTAADIEVAGSFTEFVDHYIADAPILYGQL